MFLLKFKIKDQEYYLHSGTNRFIGGETKQQAEISSLNNMVISLGVGGFTITEKSIEELTKDIGGIPYHIHDIFGGLGGGIPFHGVPLVK